MKTKKVKIEIEFEFETNNDTTDMFCHNALTSSFRRYLIDASWAKVTKFDIAMWSEQTQVVTSARDIRTKDQLLREKS